jgi:hypothetical protein
LTPLLVDIDKPDLRLLKDADYPGIVLMAICLGTLEYVLEEGTRWNWFDDTTIKTCAYIAGISGVLFIARSLTFSRPVVDLRALTNRNFALGCFLSFITGVGIFSTIFLTPLFLGYVRGFSAWQTGLAMFSTGAASLIGYKTSISICQEFLSEHAPKKAESETLGKADSKPVSPAQMLYAKKIAQEKGVVIPEEAKANSAAMSAWIDSNRSAASAVARPPTSRRDQLRLDRSRRRRGLGDAKLPLLPLHWLAQPSSVTGTPLRISCGNKEVALRLGARYRSGGHAGRYSHPRSPNAEWRRRRTSLAWRCGRQRPRMSNSWSLASSLREGSQSSATDLSMAADWSSLLPSQPAAPGMRRFPTRIVIPSARCRPNADHYPSDVGDALDEQL